MDILTLCNKINPKIYIINNKLNFTDSFNLDTVDNLCKKTASEIFRCRNLMLFSNLIKKLFT